MPDKILEYDDIDDFRYNPFTGEYNPILIDDEKRTVPAVAPFQIKLYEMPQQRAPSSFSVEVESTGTFLTEVGMAVTPAAMQYRVQYYPNKSMGKVEFNSAQAGVQMLIKYHGLGHGFQKISLDTRVPDTGDTIIAGTKTFSTAMRLSNTAMGHGMTDLLPTNVCGSLEYNPDLAGGLRFRGFGNGDEPLRITAFSGAADPDNLCVVVVGRRDGTFVKEISDTKNAFVVRNLTTDLLRVRGDGRVYINQLHLNGGGEISGDSTLRVIEKGKIWAAASGVIGVCRYDFTGAGANPPTSTQLDSFAALSGKEVNGEVAYALDDSDGSTAYLVVAVHIGGPSNTYKWYHASLTACT